MRPPRVRLNRLQVASWHRKGQKLPRIKSFKVLRDTRIRAQNSAAYERVRCLLNTATRTRIKWQYRRKLAYVREWRITWEARDGCQVEPGDVLPILRHCRFARWTLIELAFDFDRSSGVDRAFVKKHGRFGKSRLRKDRGGPGQLRYGGRKSAKLVRCYYKSEVQAYRVELELHSRFINGPMPRWNDVPDDLPEHMLQDVCSAALRILPEHLQFVRVDWDALNAYLRRKFADKGDAIVNEARRRARVSVRLLTHSLRKEGVNNVHRFFIPMRINHAMETALDEWANRFEDQSLEDESEGG